MQAKDYMSRVQKAERELHRISAKKRHYADLAMSIGAKMRAVVVSSNDNSSKTETAAIGLAEMQEMLEKKERAYVAIVREAEEKIEQIPQDKFKDVLTYRYICGESWPTIRDKLGYKDIKSAHRCNGYALQELQKHL